MGSRLDISRRAVASVLRAASVAAFAVQASTIAVTIGPLDWAGWRRCGYGFRFWRELGAEAAMLAAACLAGNLILARFGATEGGPATRHSGLYLGLNIATIVLMMFVPAVASRY